MPPEMHKVRLVFFDQLGGHVLFAESPDEIHLKMNRAEREARFVDEQDAAVKQKTRADETNKSKAILNHHALDAQPRRNVRVKKISLIAERENHRRASYVILRPVIETANAIFCAPSSTSNKGVFTYP
jgi:hypothetical protein